MHKTDLAQLDLNLLIVLSALLEECSVTRAARKLNLSQSATSHALGRLRKLFNDPLLIRTSQGMIPTPFAEQLVEPLRQILSDVRQLIQTPTFDPQTAQGTVQLVATDYATIVILPKVLQRIMEEAPNLNVECHHWQKDTTEQLRSGTVDLALGGHNPPSLGGQTPPGSKEFNAQQLFIERFVCVVRADHPVTTSAFTIDSYLAWPHALITITNSNKGYTDAFLEKLGAERRILLRLPHFLSAPLIVAKTDLILTLPQRLARLVSEFASLAILEPPIQLDEFSYIQLWHKRRQHEPMHIWLRELIARETQTI